MKTIGAAKFKERCLQILDEVPVEGVIITKHGKPVAIVMPAKKQPADFIGCLKGRGKIMGNVFSSGLKWDAES